MFEPALRKFLLELLTSDQLEVRKLGSRKRAGLKATRRDNIAKVATRVRDNRSKGMNHRLRNVSLPVLTLTQNGISSALYSFLGINVYRHVATDCVEELLDFNSKATFLQDTGDILLESLPTSGDTSCNHAV